MLHRRAAEKDAEEVRKLAEQRREATVEARREAQRCVHGAGSLVRMKDENGITMNNIVVVSSKSLLF